MAISKDLTVIKEPNGTDHWPAGSILTVALTCLQGGIDKSAQLSVVLVKQISGVVQEVSSFTTGTIAATKIVSACTGATTYVKENYYDVYGAQNPCCGAAPVGNTTPAPPTVIGNDSADTLSASHVLGDSEIVFSTNGGAFVPYAGLINVGNLARAAGYYQFKIKAATGRNESAVANSPAFTVAMTQLAAPSPLDRSNVTANGFRGLFTNKPNATDYEFQVSTVFDFASTVASGAVSSPGTFFDFVSGAPYTIYYWRVRSTASGYTPSAWVSDNVQTLESFDTILEFSAATDDSGAGVGGTVAGINATQEFAFNAITPLIGTPASMTINVSSVTEIVIDFPSDYVGRPFRYKKLDGTYLRQPFVNGIYNA